MSFRLPFASILRISRRLSALHRVVIGVFRLVVQNFNSSRIFGKAAGRMRRGLQIVLALLVTSLVTACSVDDLLRPSADLDTTTASVTSTGLQRLAPSNPTRAYPTPVSPFNQSSTMPAGEADCRRQLKRLGVKYRDLEPINEGGACRIDHPVQVSSLSGGIEIKPAITLNCQMAATFAQWTKNELAPSARMRYLSGIKSIRQGSGYSCRKINGTSVASEHSTGNAFDVMAITLNNGRTIDVRKPGLFAFRQRGLLNKVRAQGCDYFTTVLGPGYNRDHADHFHFDIKNRRNGYRACR